MSEVIPYLFVACGITVCLWIIASLRRDLQLSGSGARADEITVRQGLEEVKAGLAEIYAWLDKKARERAIGIEGECLRDNVNRLHQRGKTAPEIACSLRLPLAEVRFLLKVNDALEQIDEGLTAQRRAC